MQATLSATVNATTMMAGPSVHTIVIMIDMQVVTVLSIMVPDGGSIPVWLLISMAATTVATTLASQMASTGAPGTSLLTPEQERDTPSRVWR